MADSLNPKAHVDMHFLCGEVFDGIPRPSLTKDFGQTNVAQLADFVYAGPSAPGQ